MEEKRRRLYEQIREWNELRLDLFSLSEPNLDLEFFGVMRFYFQDEQQDRGEKVSTKCIRVSSTASARDVLAILIEKFRPDIRMLAQASRFALYEAHAGIPERRLEPWECPLLVQLNWGRDDLEGRILMKREATLASVNGHDEFARGNKSTGANSKKLSRREKKEQKKKEAAAEYQPGNENDPSGTLYNELPESSLTRSISNPEMVMRRRRQVKLEKKLQQIRTSDGGPESGGTLKIYGGAICPEVPYKTLLLSEGDRADYVVKETLEKYGLDKEDPENYCLVQVVTPYRSDDYSADPIPHEYILNDEDFPLNILIHSPTNEGQVTFQLRRRPHGMRRWSSEARQRPVEAPPGSPLQPYHQPAQPAQPYTAQRPDELPFLLEINADGTELSGAQSFIVPLNGLEVGRERRSPPGMSHLLLKGLEICPRHCVLKYADTAVMLTRLDADAAISVNGVRVFETIILRHADVILLGSGHYLRYIDPSVARVQNAAGVARAAEGIRGPSDAGSLLPATIEYRENLEDKFIATVLSGSAVAMPFKLTPTYVLYMSARHLASRRFSDVERLCRFTCKFAAAVYGTSSVQRQAGSPQGLAFWMANSSELLHFLSRDRDLFPASSDARANLARAVQLAFFSLVNVLQEDLSEVLPAFLDDRPDVGEVDDESLRRLRPKGSGPAVGDVVDVLSSVIALLLRSRVNAALTIQLFSQLFHHVSQWLFNRLVHVPHARELCTREWGRRLLRRLGAVEVWAERQGLELAAECHLARVLQAAQLLQASKATADDIAEVCTACFRLNSLQVAALLENYAPARDEPHIAHDVIARAVLIARNTADETARAESAQVTLREDPDLRLPFLLPEDGYSCEFVQGLPEEVVEFVSPLVSSGLCHLVNGPPGATLWTAYFGEASNAGIFLDGAAGSVAPPIGGGAPQPPTKTSDVIVVTFNKINNSLGLSIVAAVGEGRSLCSIYVKSVVPGGAAARDGRLHAGDLLLEVDGRSLEGLSQEAAAALMGRTGPVVSLMVRPQGAVHDGLSMLMNQPPPQAVVAGSSEVAGRWIQPSVGGAASGGRSDAGGARTQNPANQASLQPAGGRYSKLTGRGTLSRSTPNLDETDSGRARNGTGRSGIQIIRSDMPAITVLKATHNLDQRSTPTRSVNQQSGTMPGRAQQYPYALDSSRNSSQGYAPSVSSNYSDSKNRTQNAPARIQQSQTLAPSTISHQYPYRNTTAGQGQPNQQMSLHQQPYQQHSYASQPNLARNADPRTNHHPGHPASQGVRSGTMPAHSMNQGHQERSRSTGSTMAAFTPQDSVSRPYEQQSGGLYRGPYDGSSGAQRASGQPYVDSFQRESAVNAQQMRSVPSGVMAEEPQYAKVAPRGPRSQSAPRAVPPDRSFLEYAGPRGSASPWVREEREIELKRIEVEQQARRNAEILALEARRPYIGPEEADRLARLRLEVDFDRRLEEVSAENAPYDEHTEVAPTGRAVLVRTMQADLEQQRRAGGSGVSGAGVSGLGYGGQRVGGPGVDQRSGGFDRQQQGWQQTGGDTWRQDGGGGSRGMGEYGGNVPPAPPERTSSHGLYHPSGPGTQKWSETGAPVIMRQPGNSVAQQPTGTAGLAFKKSVSFTGEPKSQPAAVQGRQQAGYPYTEKAANFHNPNFGRPTNGASDDAPLGFIRVEAASGGGPPIPVMVGVQETYRDPWDRRVAGRGEAAGGDRPMPDRMSFRDKMRHFAAEAGEGTPEERVKNSRAQRALEAELSG